MHGRNCFGVAIWAGLKRPLFVSMISAGTYRPLCHFIFPLVKGRWVGLISLPGYELSNNSPNFYWTFARLWLLIGQEKVNESSKRPFTLTDPSACTLSSVYPFLVLSMASSFCVSGLCSHITRHWRTSSSSLSVIAPMFPAFSFIALITTWHFLLTLHFYWHYLTFSPHFP